jgi:hypothetical protein
VDRIAIPLGVAALIDVDLGSGVALREELREKLGRDVVLDEDGLLECADDVTLLDGVVGPRDPL